jgi:DNA-binding GntR family transcriptional regulator
MGRDQADSAAPGRPLVPIDATEAKYLLLRQHIIEGRFPPGSVLLETALSVEYGVSRTPMREALHRLTQDGLIERSTRGFRVRVRTPEEIVDIYDARIALESTGAGLAAVRHNEFDLARLNHLLEERRHGTDANALGKLNNAWHEALRVAAHNTTILDLLGRLDSMLEVYHSRRSQSASDQEIGEHEAVVAAIRDRDADTAQEAMREHLRRVRDRRIADLLAEGS